MCECIVKTNEALAKAGYSAQVKVTIITDPSSVRMQVALLNPDDVKKPVKMSLSASYCPICGEKYPETPGEKEAKDGINPIASRGDARAAEGTGAGG